MPRISSGAIAVRRAKGSQGRPAAANNSALLKRKMVGRVGVEPTTSRLSGVRSNHLSYRPPQQLSRLAARLMRADLRLAGVSQLRLSRWIETHRQISQCAASSVFPVMKGHEDGGNVLWNERRTSKPMIRRSKVRRSTLKSLERR